MRDLALQGSDSPEVRRLAYSLGNAVRINDWIRAAWLFFPDPLEAEFIQSPQQQIYRFMSQGYMVGDCDDASVVAASLLLCLSLPCKFVAIRIASDIEFSHVFVVSGCDELEIEIDPIVPQEDLPVRGVVERMEMALA